MSNEDNSALSFEFRGHNVPVTHPHVSLDLAQKAMASEPFRAWVARCARNVNKKHIEINGVEIQSVDLFGKERVGFVKIKADCFLVDEEATTETSSTKRLPGICFLRGNAVAILVALFCQETDQVYSLLVEQPRIPIGHACALELPAGMIDAETDGIAGTAAREMEEECGIHIRASELIDLTEMACQYAKEGSQSLPYAGIAPSPGGCDEFLRLLYLEKTVTKTELEDMKGRLSGLRQEGELITLRVVPFDDSWRISGDSNVMCALFLLERLRQAGKVPPPGQLATPLGQKESEPMIELPLAKGKKSNLMPRLAFGLYKVPTGPEGEEIIGHAIDAGYRHFDTASFYGNESTLGKVIRESGLPRSDFFICTKVWNDAQKEGRASVRQSVLTSLKHLQMEYVDLLLIHWPVPGCFVETYKELELLHQEGKIAHLGLSNFSPEEYNVLIDSGITVLPVVNQFEVSPAMYRAQDVAFFQDKNIVVSCSKSLHRGASFHQEGIQEVAKKYQRTPAQVFLRWGLDKGLVVVAKTINPERMKENRDIVNFSLDDEDIKVLDSLTTPQAIRDRQVLEIQRKSAM